MKITEYASRVMVFSPSGSLLFCVHPERAKLIVADGGTARKVRRGKIREITAARCVAPSPKPNSTPHLSQYMGQKYTFRERTVDADGNANGATAAFKYIHPGDRPLFLLSVTDCMRAA